VSAKRFICATLMITASSFIGIPREQWPRAADGELAMFTAPLDLIALLEEPELMPQAAAAAR
jgi:hypothetical protein